MSERYNAAVVFPQVPCCAGEPLEAGVYLTPEWFPIPFTVTLEQGWRIIANAEDNAVALVRGSATGSADRATEWLSFIPIPDGVSPDEVWARLRTTPGLVVGEDEEVSVAGLTAKQFDATKRTRC